jgi:Domain of unknown function (DUF4032)
MAGLLVDLHRHGVFWGDCSLANTLFSRDGQLLQAWLVDAETSEVHAVLSAGQRRHDLDILVENVAGGMIDLAIRLDRPPDIVDDLIAEAAGVADRYTALWDALHTVPEVSFSDRLEIESRIRTLHDLGFAVDEVRLEPAGGHDRLRLSVVVAERRFHAVELAALTGLEVGEGQARAVGPRHRRRRGAHGAGPAVRPAGRGGQHGGGRRPDRRGVAHDTRRAGAPGPDARSRR